MDSNIRAPADARGAATSTSVIFFLSAMALKIFVQRGARAVTFVPFAGRVQRVQNIDRNILLNRGQHGRRMQNFGAEIGKLGGFVKADDFDAAGIGAEARVGGHHAVDVGPDFDALGIEARAKNSGGKIRTSAADGGRDAGSDSSQ